MEERHCRLSRLVQRWSVMVDQAEADVWLAFQQGNVEDVRQIFYRYCKLKKNIDGVNSILRKYALPRIPGVEVDADKEE